MIKKELNKENFEGRNILITGGTGSFGENFAKVVLENASPRKLIIFSRDEMKQWEMQKKFAKHANIRFLLGDVRDRERLYRAFNDVDIVIHAAAAKIVPSAEYNPFECIKTNINGAMNVVDAAIDNKVMSVVALSTDKASSPINIYGASKLVSDKIFVSANAYTNSSKNTKFSVVRYGNVIGSRGSVIPFFLNLPKNIKVPITDPNMTRFMITLREGISIVDFALKNMIGGEIFVKKIPSIRVIDIADAILPGRPIEIIGIRPGEKIHEQMIAEAESRYTFDCGDHFVIVNESQYLREHYAAKFKCMPTGFKYSSDINDSWLNQEELLAKINEIKNFCK